MSEEHIQQCFCDWLKLFHPDIIFKSDLSGIKLNKGQAKKVSKGRSCNSFCDMEIYEPTEKYHGLFLEWKKETPFKKNGELKKMIRYRNINGIKVPYDHLQEQQNMIDRLNKKGYYACFVWSVEMAKEIFKNYIYGQI